MKSKVEEVLKKSTNMALATSVDNIPNVRIITFAYDIERTIYFTTFNNNSKIQEFANNPNVCLVTLVEPDCQNYTRIRGKVKKSNRPFAEVAKLLIEKFPSFSELAGMENMMSVYEVNFEEAELWQEMNPSIVKM